MTEEKRMDINRETAMALWTKRYGKTVRVKDFSGREMDKGSYDNRNSKYGWNLDHILPKSKGGKDTESNLICVHIETNDEKADKFPVFNANGKTFEIVKVENHYEIKERKNNEEKQQEYQEKGINFFDHSAALKFIKECETKKQKDARYVNTIYIRLDNVKNKAVLLFIKEVFSSYDIEVEIEKIDQWYYNDIYELYAIVDEVDSKETTNNILDCCVLLNTYLGSYFLVQGYIGSYCILNKLHNIEYFKAIKLEHYKESIVANDNVLVINDLLRINTYANKEQLEIYRYRNNLYLYNYSYTKLKENLERIKK